MREAWCYEALRWDSDQISLGVVIPARGVRKDSGDDDRRVSDESMMERACCVFGDSGAGD
jgi:hypothetical protein